MNTIATACPYCGGDTVCSRRGLFRILAAGEAPPPAFAWYSLDHPGARPPVSLIVSLLSQWPLVLAGAVAFGWSAGMAVPWWLPSAALLGGSLALDLLAVWPRYRRWGGEWLCGCCGGVFRRCPGSVARAA